MEELITNALQTGFSVAVAAYLLVRMEGRLDSLNDTLRELQVVLARMETRLGS